MILARIIFFFSLVFTPPILLYLKLTSIELKVEAPPSKVTVLVSKPMDKRVDFGNELLQENPQYNFQSSQVSTNYVSTFESSVVLEGGLLNDFSNESLNYVPTSSGGEYLEPIYRTEPVYPQSALMRNIEGQVKLKIDILPDGSVTNLRIISSYPPRVFNRSAKRAVSSWRYQKTTKGKKGHIVELKYVLN